MCVCTRVCVHVRCDFASAHERARAAADKISAASERARDTKSIVTQARICSLFDSAPRASPCPLSFYPSSGRFAPVRHRARPICSPSRTFTAACFGHPAIIRSDRVSVSCVRMYVCARTYARARRRRARRRRARVCARCVLSRLIAVKPRPTRCLVLPAARRVN